MKIFVSNNVRIESAPPKMINALKQALTLPNPVFTTLLRRVKLGYQSARCLYAVKKEFKYYEHDKTLNIFTCGRGTEMPIKKYLSDHPEIKTEWDSEFVDVDLKKPLVFNGTLRDYQVGVPEQILSAGSHGVIKLGTGYGKTLIACELIRKLNKTALIIVPRNSILAQFKETLKDFYDYDPGIIQGRIWDIKDITVASVATLKQRCCNDIKNKFSIVLVDECHTTISDKGIKTVQSFCSSYLYGLSATPKRTDEQSKAIFFTFGPILIDRALPQKNPVVQVVKTNIDIRVNINYADMIGSMADNTDRNFLIYRLAIQELKDKRKILILTKRIEHYKNIAKFFDNTFKIFQMSSDVKSEERDELLRGFRNNAIEFDVILGTFSLLSTGVDIKQLDTLIIAGDLKSSVLTQQSAGRILRLFEGKNSPKVIDLDDNLNGILKTQAQARRRFYKENNWEIV